MINRVYDEQDRVHDVWPGCPCPGGLRRPHGNHALQLKTPSLSDEGRRVYCEVCSEVFYHIGPVSDQTLVTGVLIDIVDKFPGVLETNLILACHREFDTEEKYKHLRGQTQLVENCLKVLFDSKDFVSLAFMTPTAKEHTTGTCVFRYRTSFKLNGVWVSCTMPR